MHTGTHSLRVRVDGDTTSCWPSHAIAIGGMTGLSASSVCITAASPASCTSAVVLCVTNSMVSGCRRLSSVKLETLPPPT